jgi:hypothetical protein
MGTSLDKHGQIPEQDEANIDGLILGQQGRRTREKSYACIEQHMAAK